jgi:hypothetical protein
MEEWADLEEGEQSFAVAHLLYLNLKAQADTLRVLVDVRDLLDEVADGVDQALDDDGDDHEPAGGDDDTAPGDLDGDAVNAPAVDDSSTTSTPDTDAAPVEGV